MRRLLDYRQVDSPLNDAGSATHIWKKAGCRNDRACRFTSLFDSGALTLRVFGRSIRATSTTYLLDQYAASGAMRLTRKAANLPLSAAPSSLCLE